MLCFATRIASYSFRRTANRLIECGEALGDMTSELKGSEYISEFVSGGSKNCAYTLVIW